jgi:hypothetical protein
MPGISVDRFVPVDELRRVTQGSYEHLVSRLTDALRVESPRLFGEDTDVAVLGTFPGFVLATSPAGACRRVRYTESAQGLQIGAAEEVRLPVYDRSNLEEYLQKESRRAVDLFFRGDVQEATQVISKLAPYVGKTSTLSEARVADALILCLGGERTWKALYADRVAAIHESVKDDLPTLNKAAPQPQFKKLYDGSLNEDAVEPFRPLVLEKLAAVRARLETLASQVFEASESIKAAAEQAKPGTKTLTTFAEFAEDLLDNVLGQTKIVDDLPRHVTHANHLGRVYDSLVESFADTEIASCFVVQLAKRLATRSGT